MTKVIRQTAVIAGIALAALAWGADAHAQFRLPNSGFRVPSQPRFPIGGLQRLYLGDHITEGSTAMKTVDEDNALEFDSKGFYWAGTRRKQAKLRSSSETLVKSRAMSTTTNRVSAFGRTHVIGAAYTTARAERGTWSHEGGKVTHYDRSHRLLNVTHTAESLEMGYDLALYLATGIRVPELKLKVLDSLDVHGAGTHVIRRDHASSVTIARKTFMVGPIPVTVKVRGEIEFHSNLHNAVTDLPYARILGSVDSWPELQASAGVDVWAAEVSLRANLSFGRTRQENYVQSSVYGMFGSVDYLHTAGEFYLTIYGRLAWWSGERRITPRWAFGRKSGTLRL